jgi:hypothetical protein
LLLIIYSTKCKTYAKSNSDEINLSKKNMQQNCRTILQRFAHK